MFFYFSAKCFWGFICGVIPLKMERFRFFNSKHPNHLLIMMKARCPDIRRLALVLLVCVLAGGGAGLRAQEACLAGGTVEITQEQVAQALTVKREPVTAPDAGAVKETKAVPVWAWWAAGAAALLALWAVMNAKRRAVMNAKRRAEHKKWIDSFVGYDLGARLRAELRQQQAEAMRQMLEEPVPAEAPLAFLEMCDAVQTRHPLTMKNVKIGRGKHNDIVVANDSVSGSHCVLSMRNEDWVISELESGNGVIVNGKQVKQATLKAQDVIELGDLKMRFLLKA
jgi:hypothetical protein